MYEKLQLPPFGRRFRDIFDHGSDFRLDDEAIFEDLCRIPPEVLQLVNDFAAVLERVMTANPGRAAFPMTKLGMPRERVLWGLDEALECTKESGNLQSFAELRAALGAFLREDRLPAAACGDLDAIQRWRWIPGGNSILVLLALRSIAIKRDPWMTLKN